MTDTLYRQWVTLRFIPRSPGRSSTRTLFEKLRDAGYEVTKRSVERDLEKLSQIFAFTSETEGKTAYWFWPKDAVLMDVPGLDPSAALALTLSRQNLEGLLPASVLNLLNPWFNRASEVLDSHSQQPLGHWKRKVRALARGPNMAIPKVKADVHTAVTEALLTGHQLEARYRARGQTRGKETRLHPLGLVTRDGLMYLVATAWEYPNAYQYALHRFDSAVVTEESVSKPAGFDLDDYIQQQAAFSYPTSGKALKLVADFEPKAAEHVIERPLAGDQTHHEQPDGRIRIAATVPDTSEIRWWLNGYADRVEIIGPAALRQEFAESVKRMRTFY